MIRESYNIDSVNTQSAPELIWSVFSLRMINYTIKMKVVQR
jgi:hypothetical protein